MKSNIILLGAPGSGKGTQAEKLVKELSYKHISTGDLLRSEIAAKSAIGLEVKAIIDAGKLVDDHMVLKLLKSNLNLDKYCYIFDGFPRTLNQANLLASEVLKESKYVVLYFKIDSKQLIQRICNRRNCPNCGKIYNILTHKPKIMDTCDSCSTKGLIQRKDDTEEVIKERLSVFEEMTLPLLGFYKNLGKVLEVDASEDMDLIYKKILNNL